MTRQTFKLFWQATWRYKVLLIWSEIGATIFVLSGDILPPLIISSVIDKLVQGNPSALTFGDFRNLLIAFGILRILNLLSGRLTLMTFIRFEPNVIRDLENLSFSKLQKHSMAFFADNFAGALVAKVNRLTAAYQRFIDTLLGDFSMLARRFLFTIGIVIWVHPVIGLIFLIWASTFCWSLFYLHRRKLKHSKAAAAAQTDVTARLADVISNTLVIRSYARAKEETKHFESLSQKRRDLRYRSHLISEYIRAYKGLSIGLVHILVLWLSVHYALKGSLSVGSIALIEIYLFKLINHLWDFGKVMDRMEEAFADATEMTEVIMQPHEITDPEKPEKCRIRNGEISFDDVSFQYSDAAVGSYLFKDLYIAVPAGQKLGLVGPSGGGKTTLTKLPLRFMDIQSGRILIDGQNITNIKQDDLRQKIAHVPQEPLLFHRSIYENIAYGNPEAGRESVLKAAHQAHVDEFVEQLPKGYDTVVGERGVKLSGGQRQRVSIARAMLKNAPILILDEATSSLDSASERLIINALDDLMVDRTTLVIAHRLSTIRKMDRILVMDAGKIIEDGSHDELLKRKGLYAELWAHQSGGFIGEVR